MFILSTLLYLLIFVHLACRTGGSSSLNFNKDNHPIQTESQTSTNERTKKKPRHFLFLFHKIVCPSFVYPRARICTMRVYSYSQQYVLSSGHAVSHRQCVNVEGQVCILINPHTHTHTQDKVHARDWRRRWRRSERGPQKWREKKLIQSNRFVYGQT